MASSTRFAVIVAAGRGNRMGQSTPKQFLPLAGEPILAHTIRQFRQFDPEMEITLVLSEDQIDTWSELGKKHQYDFNCNIVVGGDQRFHSVRNGLESFGEKSGIVGVHDGVRPLVSQEVLDRCYSTARKGMGCVPCIAPPESVRSIQGDDSDVLDRRNIRLVQTPQCFDLEELRAAYNRDFKEHFTDDATVYEWWGGKVKLVEGNRENVKITTPGDLEFAKSIIGR